VNDMRVQVTENQG